MEACRQRQAQQTQREGGLGDLPHLCSLGPVQAEPGDRRGDQECELTSRACGLQPAGVGMQAERRESQAPFPSLSVLPPLPDPIFLSEQTIPK